MRHHATLQKLKRLTLASAAIVTLALVVPLRVLAQSPSPLAPGSRNAAATANLFWVVSGIAAVIFIIVEALLLYAIIRYRQKYPDDMPEQIHGNTRLEIVWTIIPALILVVLFALTLPVLRNDRNPPADSMVVEVTGYQWFWEFSYPETEVTINSREGDLVIPANRPIIFEVTSADVIHSFWVAELAGKIDAIPGQRHMVWFAAEEGTYAGQCAEYCGLSHYDMLFDVVAVPEAEFQAWMNEQVELAMQFQPIGDDMEQPLPEGDPARGEQLFAQELGCNACHTLDGTQLVGPSLQNISETAEERIEGYDAITYLRESILLPCEYLVDGFTCVMPQNYGERLDAEGLADLLAYLMEQ